MLDPLQDTHHLHRRSFAVATASGDRRLSRRLFPCRDIPALGIDPDARARWWFRQRHASRVARRARALDWWENRLFQKKRSRSNELQLAEARRSRCVPDTKVLKRVLAFTIAKRPTAPEAQQLSIVRRRCLDPDHPVPGLARRALECCIRHERDHSTGGSTRYPQAGSEGG